MSDDLVSVRYMVDDVDGAIDFDTRNFRFERCAGRLVPDGRKPGPGGSNRIHFVVEDIAAEVARPDSHQPKHSEPSDPPPVLTRLRSGPPRRSAVGCHASTRSWGTGRPLLSYGLRKHP